MSVPTVSWDEAAPAGSDSIAAGDNRIRELKTQVREVVNVDHDFPSSGQDAGNGQHKQVTLQEQANLGTGTTGKCILGAQTVTTPELVFTDEADNDVQLTKGGAPLAIAAVTAKTAPVVADAMLINDSAASDISKSMTLSNLLKLVYPVGSIYMNADETVGSVNPATTFGFGTWSAMVDEVVVGKNSSGTFNTLGTLGAGAESVTLTGGESGTSAHTHKQRSPTAASGGDIIVNFASSLDQDTPSDEPSLTTALSVEANADDAHNNIQPTYVAYMWRRTA